jgi:hypothetical protein
MVIRQISTIWRRFAVALALASALSGSLVGASAHADGLGAGPMGVAAGSRILGVQPSRNIAPTGASTLASGKLTYHGGPVEHTNKVYAIYWIPTGYSVSANYVSLINRFFGDVAAANGSKTNVYYSDTQYSDTSGLLQYNSSFAGSVVDSNALPPNGCTDTLTSVCLIDTQLQTEIQNVVAAQGWTANSTTEFFMFTAKGIGSCIDGTSSQYSFSSYCAYHSWIGSGTSATLYANMPYADTSPTNCDVGQKPNNDDADATLNVTSHEHNETITDEQGNAWYDRSGFENGDKCAWLFGPVKGKTGHEYNQTINGNHYWLQMEWSNKSNKCVLQGT